MGRRSSFYMLPPATQREIERRLAANGFRDYIPIADELRRRGYLISKSALQRVGSRLEQRVMELRFARLEREGLQALEKQEIAPRMRVVDFSGYAGLVEELKRRGYKINKSPPQNLKSIGARLRFEREQRGLSQVGMAGRAGIPIQTYKKYESDKITPGGEALAGLALADVDITWVLTGREFKPQWRAE